MKNSAIENPGERSIRDLEHSLLGFEMMGEPRRQSFEDAAERYVSFYLAHMATEEQHILPLAEQVLTDDDWVDIDAAFGANRDPLAGQGHEPEADYRAIFTRILNLVPAPIGLGNASRWHRASARRQAFGITDAAAWQVREGKS